MFANSSLQKTLQQLLLIVAVVTVSAASVQPTMASTGPSIGTSVKAPMTAEDVYEETLNGTVFVVHYDRNGQRLGRGTGWIADKQRRLIITNHHVVEGASQVKVYFPEFRDGELLTDLPALHPTPFGHTSKIATAKSRKRLKTGPGPSRLNPPRHATPNVAKFAPR